MMDFKWQTVSSSRYGVHLRLVSLEGETLGEIVGPVDYDPREDKLYSGYIVYMVGDQIDEQLTVSKTKKSLEGAVKSALRSYGKELSMLEAIRAYKLEESLQ
jgi:hypothetical protein